MKRIASAAWLVLAVVTPLGAQEPVTPLPDPAAPAATPNPASGDFLPTRDLIDVLRALRDKPPPTGETDYKKKMIAGSPVVGYSPTTGFSAGLAGNVAFYSGVPLTTRISSIVASATATSKGQYLVSGRFSVNSLENRWRIEADNRFYWTSQETFGLGTNTSEDAALDTKFDHFRIAHKFYKQVFRDIFLGAGYVYNNHSSVGPNDGVDPEVFAASPYVAYSEEFGFDPDSQTSAGLSLHALLDNRDSAINPGRGWYASTSYVMQFEGLLGGTSTWQQFSYDLRTYVRLSRNARHKLGFWSFGDLVTGGVAPYLDLPTTGGDTYSRSGRGYPQGRFRGQKMMYAEAEYRWTITGNGLFGMVAFANVQTLSNDQADEALFDSYAPGGGFGFRFMLNKGSNTNLCFDIGFGKDSKAVYFGVQEAF